jgi:hypothetical protein
MFSGKFWNRKDWNTKEQAALRPEKHCGSAGDSLPCRGRAEPGASISLCGSIHITYPHIHIEISTEESTSKTCIIGPRNTD